MTLTLWINGRLLVWDFHLRRHTHSKQPPLLTTGRRQVGFFRLGEKEKEVFYVKLRTHLNSRRRWEPRCLGSSRTFNPRYWKVHQGRIWRVLSVSACRSIEETLPTFYHASRNPTNWQKWCILFWIQYPIELCHSCYAALVIPFIDSIKPYYLKCNLKYCPYIRNIFVLGIADEIRKFI